MTILKAVTTPATKEQVAHALRQPVGETADRLAQLAQDGIVVATLDADHRVRFVATPSDSLLAAARQRMLEAVAS